MSIFYEIEFAKYILPYPVSVSTCCRKVFREQLRKALVAFSYIISSAAIIGGGRASGKWGHGEKWEILAGSTRGLQESAGGEGSGRGIQELGALFVKEWHGYHWKLCKPHGGC